MESQSLVSTDAKTIEPVNGVDKCSAFRYGFVFGASLAALADFFLFVAGNDDLISYMTGAIGGLALGQFTGFAISCCCPKCLNNGKNDKNKEDSIGYDNSL